MAVFKPKPKNGRERVRRSYVVYVDTADKFQYIAKVSGVLSSELLQGVMAQAVETWERQNGEITFETPQATTDVDILAAIETAAAAPKHKRGNPHTTGRKPKQPKQ